MPIKNAIELESVLRIRLDMDQMQDHWPPEQKRLVVADHLEDMVGKGMIPPGCVVLDPPGWCRSMAAKLFVTWDGGWSITDMCRAIMAPHLMRHPGAERVPVAQYLRRLDRAPPEAIASVEDQERVAALQHMAVRASIQPSLLERLKEAKTLVKAGGWLEGTEEKKEPEEDTPFKRRVELD